ncbi:MarR family transcriptional regulator [Actinopolyspora erythraea]|uniref:MarR family transcriptional regulator n=2 Tax=Actinopolyspora erythraea TaxID=414996 RepID=A0ABR4X8D3_9ACTN|nr:MarR family transcriptional regulator [Actinopolyspora erythraea]KGI82738.1 MarR family transcriptional regulator [Actinopolyspora erythraea]
MTEELPGGSGGVESDERASVGTEREEAAAEVERELAMMFRRARKMSLEVAAEVHPELDPASYSLLLMVADAGSLRAIEVAERIGLDKSTVSRQLANLERLELLRRVPDPEDGRARLIQLSESGRSRLDQARQRRSRHLREDFVQWSTDDLHQFARLLGKLNAMY